MSHTMCEAEIASMLYELFPSSVFSRLTDVGMEEFNSRLRIMD